jgi:hypothetical protein
MPGNRRRHANALPFITVLWWITISVFFGIAGLGYVYFKNQLHHSGNEIQKLEGELAALKMQTEVARDSIAKLSSHETLKQKLTSKFFELSPIVEVSILRVNSAPAGVQAVANERKPE